MTITDISLRYRLPEAFIRQLLPLLQEEADAFFASYDQPAERGIRFREERVPIPGDELCGAVPYAKNSWYLSADSKAGAFPLHDAGAYYIQEPSAMAAVAALSPCDGDRMLDLCASPGGKSTQAAGWASLALLVSNEPIPSRAQVLSGNIERMGIQNAIVTCAYPEQLARKWPGFFDKILVDAPCSGEGMFRRHPETIAEWSPDSPLRCHQRQVQILNEAAKMLRAGGRMAYSTCTFNSIENENTIHVFLQSHPHFRLIPFHLDGFPDAQSGMLRIWPHRFRGEGHFVALLEKQENIADETAGVLPVALPKPDRNAVSLFKGLADDLGIAASPNAQFGNRLLCAPDCLPPLDGIKTLRVGLHLAEQRGRILLPDHAMALALPIEKRFEIDEAHCAAYLHGETLTCSEHLRGYYAIVYQGWQMGFGKASGGQMKNHYPKGIRK